MLSSINYLRLHFGMSTFTRRRQQIITSSGRMKHVSPPILCEWICEAWKSISIVLIKKSFKVTGISDRIHGTEDSIICEDIDCASDDKDNRLEISSQTLQMRFVCAITNF